MKKCIRCNSNNIIITKKGYGWGWGIIGLLICPLLILVGLIGMNKTIIKCNKCGFNQHI